MFRLRPSVLVLSAVPRATYPPLCVAARVGMEAPWQGESRGGWDKDGNMIIGGNEIKKQGKEDDGSSGGSSIIW
jgi:hypothetical protein